MTLINPFDKSDIIGVNLIQIFVLNDQQQGLLFNNLFLSDSQFYLKSYNLNNNHIMYTKVSIFRFLVSSRIKRELSHPAQYPGILDQNYVGKISSRDLKGQVLRASQNFCVFFVRIGTFRQRLNKTINYYRLHSNFRRLKIISYNPYQFNYFQSG